MDFIKNKRVLALAGIICLLMGTFMPYFIFSFYGYSKSISLWGYWEGKVVLILTLANALFIFQDYIEKYVPQMFNNGIGNLVKKANNPKFSLIPTVLTVAFAIYLYIRLDVDTEYLKYGLGFYSLWLGAACLVAHSFLYKKQSEQVMQNQTVNYQQPQFNQQAQQPQYTQPVQQPAVKYCPYCRNQVDINATNCPVCGNNF